MKNVAAAKCVDLDEQGIIEWVRMQRSLSADKKDTEFFLDDNRLVFDSLLYYVYKFE